MKVNFLCFILFVFNNAFAQEGDASCKQAQGYVEDLKSMILKAETASPYLKKLAEGEKIKIETAVDFLFSVDLDDDEAVNLKKNQLKENIASNYFELGKVDIAAHCKEEKKTATRLEKKYLNILNDNSRYKVSFFEMNKDQRLSLYQGVKKTSNFVQQNEEIAAKLESGVQVHKEIENAKSIAKGQAESAETEVEKAIAQSKVEIGDYRAMVSKASMAKLYSLKSIIDKYDATSTKIDEIEKALLHSKELSKSEISILFSKSKNQWRTLIDDGFAVYQMITDSTELDKFPQIPSDQILNQGIKKDVDELKQLLATASKERDELLALQKGKVKERFEEFYNLLSRVSKLRSTLLSRIESEGLSVAEMNDEYIKDLSREIFAIPFRFFGILFQKYVGIISDLSGGIFGLISIAKSVFFLLFIFSIPFLSRYLSSMLREVLDGYRSRLLKNRIRTDKFSLFLAIWIQRFTPYSPFVLFEILLILVNYSLKDTFLDEMRIIVPLLEYVVFYKIFRLLVSDVLSILSKMSNLNQQNTKQLINSTSKMVGFFFLFSYSILHMTKVTVDEGLLYRNVSTFIQFVGVFICFFAAYRWRYYISPAVNTMLTERWGGALSQWCKGRSAFFFALPTLLVIIFKLMSDGLWSWLSEFEASKRFLAKLYRRKIESMTDTSEGVLKVSSPPSSYLDLFISTGLPNVDYVVPANQKAFEEICSEINGWVEKEEDDQSIAIYGEKGIGKTTLLDRVAGEFGELNVIRINVTQKIFQKGALAQFLADQLGLDGSDSIKKSILEFNKKQDKNTLILVDDAQNLFLGKYGGFEAFREYVELVNLKTDKLFWCSVFNEYSWAYIKGVMGSAQYLRTEVFLDIWSDEAIKNMILYRHKQSDFSISYDQMILASRSASINSEAVIEAEEQFFRLLWEQSNGNPNVALFLWTHCLSVKNGTTLKVSLPERPKIEKFGQLDDNAWFVFASIAKHENLTRNEVVSTTNLEWAQVAHAIKMGLESRLIYKSEGNRYRLHFSFQYDLIKQLRMKNFIYGIN